MTVRGSKSRGPLFGTAKFPARPLRAACSAPGELPLILATAREIRSGGAAGGENSLPAGILPHRPEGRRRDPALRGGFVGGGDPQHHVLAARLGAEHQRERQARRRQRRSAPSAGAGT